MEVAFVLHRHSEKKLPHDILLHIINSTNSPPLAIHCWNVDNKTTSHFEVGKVLYIFTAPLTNWIYNVHQLSFSCECSLITYAGCSFIIFLDNVQTQSCINRPMLDQAKRFTWLRSLLDKRKLLYITGHNALCLVLAFEWCHPTGQNYPLTRLVRRKVSHFTIGCNI